MNSLRRGFDSAKANETQLEQHYYAVLSYLKAEKALSYQISAFSRYRLLTFRPDPLGYYIGPWGYAQMEVLAQAIVGTKSLNDDKLADYIRANTFKTVVGDVKFGKDGEWAQSRVLQVQFQNVKGNDVAQFRDISTQVVLTPSEYASGKVIYPYEKAK